GDAFVLQLGIEGGKRGEPGSDAAVGDPALLAIEHIAVALLLDARAHPGDVAAGVGLAARISRIERTALAVAGGERAEVTLSLLLATGNQQRDCRQGIARERRVHARAAIRDLLQYQAVRETA